MHSEITSFHQTKYNPTAKRQQWSGGLQCPCIYCIELDSSVSKIARKEMQGAVNGAGLMDM